MKVLENGLTVTDRIYCPKCFSLLEINSSDLVREHVSTFCTPPVIKCPVCGEKSIYRGRKLKV